MSKRRYNKNDEERIGLSWRESKDKYWSVISDAEFAAVLLEK